MHIGKKLSRIREILGIKQETLAMNLQISQQQISRLEQSEEIGAEPLLKIASAMGISVNAVHQFSEERLLQFILTVNDDQIDPNGLRFHPLQKIVELYEDKVHLLERLLAQTNKTV